MDQEIDDQQMIDFIRGSLKEIAAILLRHAELVGSDPDYPTEEHEREGKEAIERLSVIYGND